MSQRVRSANRYRDSLNPTVALTLTRARYLIESYTRGEFADLMWTFGAPFTGIESADPDYLALIERRISAVAEMDWDIKQADKTRADFDPRLAEEQAAALSETFDGIENINEAIEHLVMASFRGFSHLERVNANDGEVIELRPVDQWNVVRDGTKGGWRYNPDARQTNYSSLPAAYDMTPDAFIIREAKRPIGRYALVKFIRANLSEKDWDGFIEIYGIPGGIVTGPPNVPAEKEAEYEAAAQEVATGGSGYLPNGATYTANDSPRGSSPFQQRLEWLSQKLILAGTGGQLTMLSAPGTGTLAGGAHAETFRQLARAESRDITALLHRAVAREVLLTKFPGRPELAYFEINFRESVSSADVIKDAGTLASAGFQMDAAELSEKTGYRLTLKAPAGAPTLPALRPTLLNRAPAAQDKATATLLKAALQGVGDARATALQPVLTRLRNLLDGSDAEFESGLRQLRADLPGLAPEILKDPATLKAWEGVLGAALASGLSQEKAKA
jgi:phage gp29-like protein